MAKTYDYLFKLLLIGDSGVGKTCVLFRFSEDAFNATFISTIGIDFKIRTIDLDGKKIKLQIWDTAGQERFRTITTAYYRGAMGIMLVYDITSEKSFDNIKNWIRNIEEHAAQDVEKMILGNKCDMNDRREVTRERGEELAIEYGIKFMETSAKASINVEEAFYTLARDIKAKMEKILRSTEPATTRRGRNQPGRKRQTWSQLHAVATKVLHSVIIISIIKTIICYFICCVRSKCFRRKS